MRHGLAILALALSLPHFEAVACSCVRGYSKGECQLPDADTIVLARVVAVEVKPFVPPPRATGQSLAQRIASSVDMFQPEPWGSEKVTLHVSERFRGASGDSLVVRTEPNTASCGYPFAVGHDYLVFADKRQGGELTVSSCSATRPARGMVSRILQLRAARDGTVPPDLFGFIGTHPDGSDLNAMEQVEPVPNLTVAARSEAGEYRTQTAADGTYEFHGLTKGEYNLSAESLQGRRTISALGAETIRTGIASGCPKDFDVYWDGRISGTVVDRLGQEMAGYITAQYVGPEKTDIAAVGVSVRAGRFEVQRLRRGRYRLAFLGNGRPIPPAVYYTGTESQGAATLVDVGEGSHVDGLQFVLH